MATPRIRGRGRRRGQTPIHRVTPRAQRWQRPSDANPVTTIHTNQIATNRSPVPVDVHAERFESRPLTANHRQLPHRSSREVETERRPRRLKPAEQLLQPTCSGRMFRGANR
jgi:hypothetical protein